MQTMKYGARKKNNTALYIGLGCGGILLAGAALTVAAVVWVKIVVDPKIRAEKAAMKIYTPDEIRATIKNLDGDRLIALLGKPDIVHPDATAARWTYYSSRGSKPWRIVEPVTSQEKDLTIYMRKSGEKWVVDQSLNCHVW